MSEELYEIAFSGQIVEGADLDMVKLQLGRIFKADQQRLAQMFSGRRVLIKRQADAATMARYRGAFEKVGAICEVRRIDGGKPAEHATGSAANSNTGTDQPSSEPYQSRYPESDIVPQALLTDPLGIDGEHIDTLKAEVAPVGSPMQHRFTELPEPQFDLNGLDIAPLGSRLSREQAESPPPPPDTSGLSVEKI